MPDSVLILILFLFALALGYFAGLFISNLKHKGKTAFSAEKNSQLQLQVEELKSQLNKIIEDYRTEIIQIKSEGEARLKNIELEREEIRKEKDLFSIELTRRNSEYENLLQRNNEQKQEVEQLQEKFTKEFENLANRILDNKSEKFTLLNKENLQNILTPLNEKIKSFEEKVDKNSNDFIERYAQLGKQLQFLNEQNIKISEEATNLTKALKGDTQMQGSWGEMILESVLERSGLKKDCEYFVQQNFHTEEGRNIRPDVVIHLPGNKKMI